MSRGFDFDRFDDLCAEVLDRDDPLATPLRSVTDWPGQQMVDAEVLAESEDLHLADKIMTMEYHLWQAVNHGTLTHAEAQEHLDAYTAFVEGEATDQPTLRCLGQLGLGGVGMDL